MTNTHTHTHTHSLPPSWACFPPQPTPSHPWGRPVHLAGLPGLPSSFLLAVCFTYDSVCKSVLFPQVVLPSPSPTVSTSPFSTSARHAQYSWLKLSSVAPDFTSSVEAGSVSLPQLPWILLSWPPQSHVPIHEQVARPGNHQLTRADSC